MFEEKNVILDARHVTRRFPSAGGKELTACDGEGPVLSFNDLTDEEKEEMQNELVEGLTPVLQFISPALPA